MSAPPVPRLCVVEKASAEHEYGFNLHAERGRGQFVGAVDIGSAADIGGLKSGDHIIAVNGETIAGLTHKEVVSRIKSDPTRCSLLVLDEESVQWYKEHNVPLVDGFDFGPRPPAETIDRPEEEGEQESGSCSIAFVPSSGGDASTTAESTPVPGAEAVGTDGSEPSPAADQSPSPTPAVSPHSGSVLSPASAGDGTSPATIPRHHHHRSQLEAATPAQLQAAGPKPRLCSLVKNSPAEEFGFNLHAERGKGHFVGAVDKDGIAERAGLETGQRIVGVNGRLVSAQTPHKDIVQLIKRDPLSTELLVASEEVDRFYTEYALAFSYDHVQVFDRSLRNGALHPNGRSRGPSVVSKVPSNGSAPRARLQSQPRSNTVEERKSEGEEMERREKRAASLSRRPPTPTSTYTYPTIESLPPVTVQIQVQPDNRTDIRINDPEEQTEHTAESPTSTTMTEAAGTPNGKHVLAGVSPPPPPQMFSPTPPPAYQKDPQSSPLSDASRISPLEIKGFIGENGGGCDIFALSAQEARQVMRGRKRDPRLDSKMTLEEKYRLIRNL